MDKKKVFTTENALKIDDYNEDDLYDLESSSDEDTGLTLNIKSLEEEENHLNKLKLRLKIVKAKTSLIEAELKSKEQQEAPRREVKKEPKAQKKCPKRTNKTNLKTRKKAWLPHGLGRHETEVLFFSTTTRICR